MRGSDAKAAFFSVHYYIVRYSIVLRKGVTIWDGAVRARVRVGLGLGLGSGLGLSLG